MDDTKKVLHKTQYHHYDFRENLLNTQQMKLHSKKFLFLLFILCSMMRAWITRNYGFKWQKLLLYVHMFGKYSNHTFFFIA